MRWQESESGSRSQAGGREAGLSTGRAVQVLVPQGPPHLPAWGFNPTLIDTHRGLHVKLSASRGLVNR